MRRYRPRFVARKRYDIDLRSVGVPFDGLLGEDADFCSAALELLGESNRLVPDPAGPRVVLGAQYRDPAGRHPQVATD